MIDKLILHNYQSHADSIYDFSDGITSIIGESNAGKTAAFRAFDGIRENRQFGFENASHWITEINEKGVITLLGTMSVTAVLSEGKYITRERNKDGFNGYRIGNYIDDKMIETQNFNKVGKNVPFPVRDLLNMEDVNIQNQHDSMFLLSESGQDVARYFNKLIKLDIADTALAASERKKRKAKAGVDESKKEIDELDELLKKLNWTDEASKMADRIEIIETKIKTDEDKIYDIDGVIQNMSDIENKCVLPEYHEKASMTIERIDIIKDKITNLDDKIYSISVLETDIQHLHDSIKKSEWLLPAKRIITEIDVLDMRIIKASEDNLNLEFAIINIEQCTSCLEEADYTEKAIEILNKLLTLDKIITNKDEKIDDIDISITKIKVCEKKISTGMSSITALQAELPDTCPTCGQSLKDTA